MADTVYGLTPAGFLRPDFQTIRAEVAEDCRVELGIPDLVLQGGKWGRFIDLFSTHESKLWDAMQVVYESRTPKGAQGLALDDISALTGTRRLKPRKSRAVLRLVGTAGATAPQDFTAAITGTGTRFLTLADATLEAADAWAATTPYALTDVVTLGGYVYEATTAGVSGSVGPVGPGTALADGTVVWKSLGNGNAVALVTADAEVTGPVVATAGTINQIVTSVAGVSAVANPADAAVGDNREEDPALRIRRENELRAPGAAAADAIRARVLRVGNGTNYPVEACTVFFNDYDWPVDGLPAKSFEVVVQGGLDAAVALAIWKAKPVGIYSHGATAVTVQDATGKDQVVRLTRPEPLLLYVAITIEKGKEWPADPADAAALIDSIKKSVASYNTQLSLGERAVRNFLFGLTRVAGDSVISDVPQLFIGLAPNPTGTANIQPTSRQIVRLDTSRISVTAIAP